MTTSIIARVNNVDIMSISDERLVPIKPIVPTALLCKAVGTDGKQREMFCLPMEYIFGWLINY